MTNKVFLRILNLEFIPRRVMPRELLLLLLLMELGEDVVFLMDEVIKRKHGD